MCILIRNIKYGVFNVGVKWTNGVSADCLYVDSRSNFRALSQIVLCGTAIRGGI